jgi:hypothetical protein
VRDDTDIAGDAQARLHHLDHKAERDIVIDDAQAGRTVLLFEIAPGQFRAACLVTGDGKDPLLAKRRVVLRESAPKPPKAQFLRVADGDASASRMLRRHPQTETPMPVFQQKRRRLIGIVLPVENHLVAVERGRMVEGDKDAARPLIGFQFTEDGGFEQMREADDSAGPLAAQLPYLRDLRPRQLLRRIAHINTVVNGGIQGTGVQRLLHPENLGRRQTDIQVAAEDVNGIVRPSVRQPPRQGIGFIAHLPRHCRDALPCGAGNVPFPGEGERDGGFVHSQRTGDIMNRRRTVHP